MTDINIHGTPTTEELWVLLETDKDKFVATMRLAQADHDMKVRANPWSGVGNLMYTMMQGVWTDFHKNNGKRPPPPPPPPPPHPEAEFWNRMRMPLNPGSAQPALTQTSASPQVVQWVQGNRIILRPENREVVPGEPMTSVRIR